VDCTTNTSGFDIRQGQDHDSGLRSLSVNRGAQGKSDQSHDPLSGPEKIRINSIGNGNTIVDCLSLAMVVRVVR
jgi:hypothetical protein